MPDSIERLIYKLEIDDSGFIRGVESMSESTKRLVEVQNQSNKQLQTNEAALKVSSDQLAKAKKDLDAYTGSNEALRKQLQKTFTDAEIENQRLTTIVNDNRKAYEAATKAAQDFATSSARANNLQQTTGGKIPTQIPLGIQPTVVSDLTNIIKTGDLSGLPEVLAESAAQFEVLRKAITDAEQRMQSLNAADEEFIALQEFVERGSAAITAYDNAVQLAATSTVELAERVREAQVEVERIGQVSPKELPEQVRLSKVQFDELAVSISGAEARLKTLDVGSEEFQQLEQVINSGKAALESYNAATVKTGQSTLSLRSQIRLGREELVRMEQAGQSATKEFFELEKRVASLTDAYGDQQERIKVLSSDTRTLDFGKAAITTATAAFQAYTSVSILAGGASEDLQKKTLQLFAAMQVLTALEQLSNSVKRGSVIATNLQAASQAAYTFVVSASTTALKAYRIALLSTGIGAAVVLVGFLVKKFIDYKNAVAEAAENQKLLNDVVHQANEEAGKQISDLKILTEAVKDSTLPLEQRLEAVRALQKEFPDYFGSLTQEAILTGDITKQTEALTIAIQASSRARAAKGKIDAIESERLDLDFQRQAVRDAVDLEKSKVKEDSGVITTGGGVAGTGGGTVTGATVAQQKAAIDLRAKAKLDDIKDKDDALQRQEDFLIKFVGLDQLTKVTTEKTDKEKKETTKKVAEIQNEFERKKAELDKRLADLTATEADRESNIRIEFAKRLAREQAEIEKLVKEKKIKGTVSDITDPNATSQAAVLGQENIRINTLELEKALADFRKKSVDAKQKLADELRDIQEKTIQDTLNLIQDDFDRRAALIEFNEKREIANAEEASNKRLASLELDRLLIGEQAYQNAREIIIETGERNILNVTRKFAEERNALAIQKFNEYLTFIEEAISDVDLEIDEGLATELRSQSNRFLAGEISFEQYQKSITAIQRREESIRRDRTLFLQKVEIEDLQVHLDSISDKTSKEYIDLQNKIEQLRKRFADGTKADASADAADINAEDSEEAARLARISSIASSIGEVTNSVISFWQQANAAESAALDRSIALQEKRVDAAQRIAERGNAQYLKAETDRLKELQVARENAARRELAINAALQASQLLVGITGAITKIANPLSGTAEVIAAIAVIFGALATGYGLVKSLQGNQPQFKEGTKSVKRAGQPAGVDTIQAWVSEGEAIIPARTNKEYHPAVSAIYDKKIPAEVLNNYVNNYVNRKEVFEKIHTVKPIAQPNYERIGEAATTHIQHDSKLAGLLMEHSGLLKENNELQKQILKKKMNVEQRIDRNGVAQMVTEFLDQKRKDSRT